MNGAACRTSVNLPVGVSHRIVSADFRSSRLVLNPCFGDGKLRNGKEAEVFQPIASVPQHPSVRRSDGQETTGRSSALPSWDPTIHEAHNRACRQMFDVTSSRTITNRRTWRRKPQFRMLKGRLNMSFPCKRQAARACFESSAEV